MYMYIVGVYIVIYVYIYTYIWLCIIYYLINGNGNIEKLTIIIFTSMEIYLWLRTFMIGWIRMNVNKIRASRWAIILWYGRFIKEGNIYVYRYIKKKYVGKSGVKEKKVMRFCWIEYEDIFFFCLMCNFYRFILSFSQYFSLYFMILYSPLLDIFCPLLIYIDLINCSFINFKLNNFDISFVNCILLNFLHVLYHNYT